MTVTNAITQLAFVGQNTYFASCAAEGRCGSFEACFIDFRKGMSATDLMRQLELAAPDLVIVFKPEIIPPGLFADLDAVTVGYLTEPLPASNNGDCEPHSDLARRLQNLKSIDSSNFDRIVTYNPNGHIPEDLGFAPWRAMPLPVADQYFRPVGVASHSRSPLFIGRSTPHREEILSPAKHAFDILHIAHGVGSDTLPDVLAATDVGINVHNEDYPNFEHRATLHLASAHLLISEELEPTYGLDRGLDYLEIDSAADLVRLLRELRRAPDIFRRVRIRGRAKAEMFRASKVYDDLLVDLRRDLAVFGSNRSTVKLRAV